MSDSRDWKRQFFPMWVGQAFSMLGSNLVSFALVWWLTDQTGSATVLTIGTLIAMIPNTVLGPLTGALVDRWNRKTIMIVSDSMTALFTVALAAIFAYGHVQVWHIFLLNFLRSLGGALQWPAMRSSTSLMVPTKHLTRINGINQALQGILQVAAPPLGALLISILPIQLILLIDVVSAFFAVTPLFFIRVPQPEKKQTARPTTLYADIKEAAQYLYHWKGMMVLIFSAAALNFLLAPASALVPLLVTRRFGGKALELAWMNSAYGIGLISGGLLMGAWGGFKHRVKTIVLGAAGMGAGICLLAVAPGAALWMGFLGMGLSGFMNPVCNSPLTALMQSSVEPSMQGRVFTLVGSVGNLATPLAMIISGPVADAVGIDIWYWIGGLGTLALTAVLAGNRPLMRLEQEAQERQTLLNDTNTPETANL